MYKQYTIILVVPIFNGLSTIFAYDDLSVGKNAEHWDPYYSSFYENHRAYNALDRNTSTCTRTIDIGRTSPRKTAWWIVDLGMVYNIYSVDIYFKNYDHYEKRQQGRFAGFSIYISKSKLFETSLCYKDGPQLPSLNFTQKCLQQGRHVIVYTERLDEITYPVEYQTTNVFIELCEVIVLGCNDSNVFGRNCDKPCPTTCSERKCHIVHGTCLKCRPGWTGYYCNQECKYGWFGQDCSQQCAGQCKDNATCNHLTGQCDSGCADGWTGENCSKACDSGFYGNNCSSVCFLNCPNCRHTDGYCDYVTEFRGFNGSTESVTAYSADQNTLSISSWVVGFSISILVNIILLVSSGLLLRFYLNKRKGKPTQMNYQFSESRESHGYEDLRAATNVNTYDNLTFP